MIVSLLKFSQSVGELFYDTLKKLNSKKNYLPRCSMFQSKKYVLIWFQQASTQDTTVHRRTRVSRPTIFYPKLINTRPQQPPRNNNSSQWYKPTKNLKNNDLRKLWATQDCLVLNLFKFTPNSFDLIVVRRFFFCWAQKRSSSVHKYRLRVYVYICRSVQDLG